MSKSIFGGSLERPSRTPKLQSGVLAYKVAPNGKVRILLVKTTRSKKWSIPKGKARSDLTLAANAAKEAFEEAGVKGEIAPSSAGMFRTSKRIWYGDAIIEVWVYSSRSLSSSNIGPSKVSGRRSGFHAGRRAKCSKNPSSFPSVISLSEVGRNRRQFGCCRSQRG
jgi:8-oxo-dGTP pyrophosphatase MutT (NUDIX family)